MLNNPLPKYLTDKKNIVRLILLTALFAVVFINIYAPFGLDSIYELSELEFLGISSLIILTGVLVVVISRIIMYKVSKRKELLVWQYIIWVFAEVLAMAVKLYTVRIATVVRINKNPFNSSFCLYQLVLRLLSVSIIISCLLK